MVHPVIPSCALVYVVYTLVTASADYHVSGIGILHY